MNLNYYKIKHNQTLGSFIRDFERIKKNDIKLAIKLSKDNELEGIITLGDLRKIIEKKYDIKTLVKDLLNKKPIVVKENELNNNLYELLLKKISRNKDKIDIEEVIVIDKKNKFSRVLSFKSICENYNYKNICIVGLGHIGIPLAIHILKKFKSISGFDIDKKKIKDIKNLKLSFYEKNLDKSLKFYLSNDKFRLTSEIKKVSAEIYIICIGSDLTKNKADNKKLVKVAKNLSKKLKKNDIIILRGTVPVGGSRNLFLKELTKGTSLKPGYDFYFSYMPERIIEGNALEELEKIPQLVSGFSKNCEKEAINFSKNIFNNIVNLSSIEEGEIIKLASNSFRDLNFAFSNEISRIANLNNLSGSRLIEKANYGYSRNNFSKPSIGVGGFCLPKDPFLFKSSIKNSHSYKLGVVSRKINDETILFYGKNIIRKLNSLKKKSKKILIMGLTFKGFPETLDIRNSPGIELGNFLKKNKIICEYMDPMHKSLKKIIPKNKFKIIDDKVKLNNYDMIIVINNNQYFFDIIESKLKLNNSKNSKYIFDCWNILNESEITNLNWSYLNI
jgi:UDP-N-acetyl-D-mannosaminuronic acid dehydrogenase